LDLPQEYRFQANLIFSSWLFTTIVNAYQLSQLLNLGMAQADLVSCFVPSSCGEPVNGLVKIFKIVKPTNSPKKCV
jgi:hypothetical protein